MASVAAALPPAPGPTLEPTPAEDLSPISSLARSLGYGTGTDSGAGTAEQSRSGSSIIDKLLQAANKDIPYLQRDVAELPAEAAARGQFSSDIGYLRATPYTSTEEQAMRASMQENIKNEYDTARQRMRDELGARQGFSGVLQEEEDRLAQEEAQKLSNVDRDLMIRGADERRSRLGEARGLAETLAQAERGRETTGVQRRGQARDVLSSLEALERQRQLQAMGIESTLNDEERQRLMDLMAALGLAPNLGTAGGLAANMVSQGNAGTAASQGGLRNLADLIARQ